MLGFSGKAGLSSSKEAPSDELRSGIDVWTKESQPVAARTKAIATKNRMLVRETKIMMNLEWGFQTAVVN